MHQERHYPGRVMATDLVNPDFAAFARSFGAYGERVEETGAFAAALERALAAGGPALLELVCDPEALTPRQSLSEARAQGERSNGELMEPLHTWPARRHRRRGARAGDLRRGGHAPPPRPHRRARAPARGHHA